MADDHWQQGAARAGQEKQAQYGTDSTRHDHAADPLRNVPGTEPNGLRQNGQSEAHTTVTENLRKFSQQEATDVTKLRSPGW